MSAHPGMTVLRRWMDEEGHERDRWGDWVWPAPPEYVESLVEGGLRREILNRLGRHAGDPCQIRIIEGETEGGYSEYTVEFDYSVEVWVQDGEQSQRVFSAGDWYSSADGAFAALMRWVESA